MGGERKTIAISELKAEKWYAQGGLCLVCCEPVTCCDELAHRIPQARWAMKRWGPMIIHHPRNLVLVHHDCNDAVSISNHPVECERLAREIGDSIIGSGK